MQGLKQSQSQKQVQKLSQRQIQAISFLAMSSRDLREEILKAVAENPALKIVRDSYKNKQNSITANDFQAVLENNADDSETLQHHLMSQVNMARLSADEKDLCQRLIYNLDKYGFYGSMAAPETLLDKTRPLQNKFMLDRCIKLIQNMDPVGVCCKNPEESLFIQAKFREDASNLVLFILDGNLELLNPPNPEIILRKLLNFKKEYHQKVFTKEILLDKVDLNLDEVNKALHYITSLNPYPASEYKHDGSHFDYETPDVVLEIQKCSGNIYADDFSKGCVYFDNKTYFQIKYASGILPEVQLAPGMDFDKDTVESAKAFLSNLEYRKNSMILQGCEIVHSQKQFFAFGPGNLQPLTRRHIAEVLGIHESTVSRLAAKKNSKYFQTEWGVFPASYFFVSGVSDADGKEKISADVIKTKITEYLEGKALSDNEICKLLNEEGIKIARRTVAKYRQQAGIQNSYIRK